MITFEITLKGFDGRTDSTDHLVKWISAKDRTTLNTWLKENSLTDYLFCEPRNLVQSGCVAADIGQEDGVDIILGAQPDQNTDIVKAWRTCIINHWKQQSIKTQNSRGTLQQLDIQKMEDI